MFHYRKANINDIDILTRMRISMLCEETDFTDEFKEILRMNTEKYIAQGLQDTSFIAWVAVSGEEIIAMSGLTIYTLPPNDWCPTGKTAYIGNMYTLPDFRKQGIASKLFSIIIEEVKGMGCERIILNATDSGRPIYEKFGFENYASAMAYYPFGICDIKHLS